MGTYSQNLVPGSDNTYDLGRTSARWKDLFLRHGVKLYDASGSIWELDYRGITRSGFEGTAALTPAALDNPDEVTITLPRYIGCDFVVSVSGARGSVTKNTTIYDIYPYWSAPIFACSPTVSAFTASVTWDVFRRTDNFAYTGNGHIRWNNLRQLCLDCGFSLDDIPTGLKTVHWIVRWPL